MSLVDRRGLKVILREVQVNPASQGLSPPQQGVHMCCFLSWVSSHSFINSLWSSGLHTLDQTGRNLDFAGHIWSVCAFFFFLSVPFRNVKCLLSLPAVHAKPKLRATFCRPLLSSIQRALQAVLESILVVCLCTAPSLRTPPFQTFQVTKRDLIYLTLGKELGSPSFRLGTFSIGFLSCLQGDRTGSKIK